MSCEVAIILANRQGATLPRFMVVERCRWYKNLHEFVHCFDDGRNVPNLFLNDCSYSA